ncbi:hypothetical protein AK812_SmicGene45181, partial [Symbiodinium microadriaticum]
MSSVEVGSCQLLKEFVKVTGMRESELNLGNFGVPGRKPVIATTNYHLDGLKLRSVAEVARAIRENDFEDKHVASGGSMKAAKMKYLLVAKSTIPESYVTGEFVPKMIASFGSKVLVKKRRYAASGALNRLEFEERWSEGLYLGLSDQVADGHLVYVDGTFTHTRSVRDKSKLVDAGEHQQDEDQEMPVLEDGQDPPARGLRIHGKSAPRIAAIGGDPEDVGDLSGRGHSPDLEHHEGGPKGRGHSPDHGDLSSGVENSRAVCAPWAAVWNGNLVTERYEDELP